MGDTGQARGNPIAAQTLLERNASGSLRWGPGECCFDRRAEARQIEYCAERAIGRGGAAWSNSSRARGTSAAVP